MSSANGLPEAFSASTSPQLISIVVTCVAFALIPLFISTVYLYNFGKNKVRQVRRQEYQGAPYDVLTYRRSLSSSHPATVIQSSEAIVEADAEIVGPEKNDPSHSPKKSEEDVPESDWLARNIREDSLEDPTTMTMTRRWSEHSSTQMGKKPFDEDVEANQSPRRMDPPKKCPPPKKPGFLSYLSATLDRLTEISEIFNSTVRMEKEPPSTTRPSNECFDETTQKPPPPPPPPPPPSASQKPKSGRCVKKEKEPP